MPDTAYTFKGDNGEIEIEVSADGKDVTITVKPKEGQGKTRVFRPKGRFIYDKNDEPTGKIIELYSYEDVTCAIFIRDDCTVVCKVIRKKQDGELEEAYSFELKGLSKDEKKRLLRTLEKNVGLMLKVSETIASQPTTFAARLTAPGDIWFSVGNGGLPPGNQSVFAGPADERVTRFFSAAGDTDEPAHEPDRRLTRRTQ